MTVRDAVLSSDGETNLLGEAKLGAIQRDCEGSEFEYLGNSTADVPIWRHAAVATLVQPSAGAVRAAGAGAAAAPAP